MFTLQYPVCMYTWRERTDTTQSNENPHDVKTCQHEPRQTLRVLPEMFVNKLQRNCTSCASTERVQLKSAKSNTVSSVSQFIGRKQFSRTLGRTGSHNRLVSRMKALAKLFDLPVWTVLRTCLGSQGLCNAPLECWLFLVSHAEHKPGSHEQLTMGRVTLLRKKKVKREMINAYCVTRVAMSLVVLNRSEL